MTQYDSKSRKCNKTYYPLEYIYLLKYENKFILLDKVYGILLHSMSPQVSPYVSVNFSFF